MLVANEISLCPTFTIDSWMKTMDASTTPVGSEGQTRDDGLVAGEPDESRSTTSACAPRIKCACMDR